jgi:hypothetical protein
MVNVKKNVLTQKQALEENVGTYHHPTNKTWRSGACVIGEELRKGYYRNGFLGGRRGRLQVGRVCTSTGTSS